jgi:hypothetical protein
MVPFWDTIGNAYWSVLRDIIPILRLFWKPFLLGYAASFFIGFIGGFFQLPKEIYLTIGAYIQNIFLLFGGIAIHRLRIFNDCRREKLLSFKLDLCFFVFAIFASLHFLAFDVVPLVAIFIYPEYILSIPFSQLLVISILFPSLLVLPSAAAGRAAPIRYGLQLMRGVFWRTIGIFAVGVCIPVLVIQKIHSKIELMDKQSFAVFGDWGFFLPSFAELALVVPALLLCAVSITIVCEIYKIRSAQIELA